MNIFLIFCKKFFYECVFVCDRKKTEPDILFIYKPKNRIMRPVTKYRIEKKRSKSQIIKIWANLNQSNVDPTQVWDKRMM